MEINFKNLELDAWVREMADLCRPKSVYTCNGSKKEFNTLMKKMVASGAAIPLKKRPGSYLFRSDPSDVARIEKRTFISTPEEINAGPTNNWKKPEALNKIMHGLYKDCMKERTMYVIPYSMGPLESPFSIIGVQITDSPYVVVNMHIMTRVGTAVLEKLSTSGTFIHCMHSVGSGAGNEHWVCSPMEKKYVCHFLGGEKPNIKVSGSEFGGNALSGKKSVALRMASCIAQKEGWMAEHMMLLRLISPENRVYHFAAAAPSSCGKTNLAMITPTLPGWKAECIGDDIAWMRQGDDGRLYAINPESGFFGVVPGTSYKTNPNAMKTIERNTLFTNCALTDDGDVWWEGKDGETPKHLIDWTGKDWTPKSKTPAAHPNARFTAQVLQCPVFRKEDWENSKGVPIDAIIFGGRRQSAVPLVSEALNWDHGVFLGATLTSETTAANIGEVGELRIDSMAMKPFCGYHMGDYLQHWLDMGDKLGDKAPKIFYVNWFRKDDFGNYLWPGFGENSRVLKWICERVDDDVGYKETPVGRLPIPTDIDITGLRINSKVVEELLDPKVTERCLDIKYIDRYFSELKPRLPERMAHQFGLFSHHCAAA